MQDRRRAVDERFRSLGWRLDLAHASARRCGAASIEGRRTLTLNAEEAEAALIESICSRVVRPRCAGVGRPVRGVPSAVLPLGPTGGSGWTKRPATSTARRWRCGTSLAPVRPAPPSYGRTTRTSRSTAGSRRTRSSKSSPMTCRSWWTRSAWSCPVRDTGSGSRLFRLSRCSGRRMVALLRYSRLERGWPVRLTESLMQFEIDRESEPERLDGTGRRHPPGSQRRHGGGRGSDDE